MAKAKSMIIPTIGGAYSLYSLYRGATELAEYVNTKAIVLERVLADMPVNETAFRQAREVVDRIVGVGDFYGGLAALVAGGLVGAYSLYTAFRREDRKEK